MGRNRRRNMRGQPTAHGIRRGEIEATWLRWGNCVHWFEDGWHYCRLRLNTQGSPTIFETEHVSPADARRMYAQMQRDLMDARPYGYGGQNLTDAERAFLKRDIAKLRYLGYAGRRR